MPLARKIGEYGEKIAVDYLLSQNYKIIDRNFHRSKGGKGEIDIVAEDGEVLCFVEVKYYQKNSLRSLAFAVDPAKQVKIIKTAQYYVFAKKIEKRYIRFDVVLMEYAGENQVEKIDLIKDAYRP